MPFFGMVVNDEGRFIGFLGASDEKKLQAKFIALDAIKYGKPARLFISGRQNPY